MQKGIFGLQIGLDHVI